MAPLLGSEVPPVGRRTVVPGRGAGEALVTVTAPLVPEWEALAPLLQDVLGRRWLTNQGHYAQTLTSELKRVMSAPELSLVSNGTLALELLLRAAVPPGEVIVPAFSFPATWNLLCRDPAWTPVFVDIGPDFCVDPAQVAAAITPRTSAILAVHTYGRPCDSSALGALAARHGLKLVFDAAHAFGVALEEGSLAALGDGSAWSFHATKVFSTLEGGAVTSRDAQVNAHVDRLRNFGFAGLDGQTEFGTNAKVDEFRAAFGLSVLPLVEGAIARRVAVGVQYLERLAPLEGDGVALPRGLFEDTAWTPNGAYFPVLFPPECGLGPEELSAGLQAVGVLPRRYFDDRAFKSAIYAPYLRAADTPRALEASQNVLCLPIHHDLGEEDLDLVCTTLLDLFGH
ncbi:MAG: DegT/DnrJ/EryC1/StrS family aminotransferase [Planctomycetota bacterium]